MTLRLSDTFPVSLKLLPWSSQTKHPTTIHLSARGITSASCERNVDLTHSLGTLQAKSRKYRGISEEHNPTNNLTDFCASEVLDNHSLVLTSFWIETKDDELGLSYIYLIPKMHKSHYKHIFIAVHQSAPPSLFPFFSQKCLHTYIKQVLQNSLLKTWDQSDVDPLEFQGVIRTSSISNFQPCNKHQVFWIFHALYNHISPDIEKQTH